MRTKLTLMGGFLAAAAVMSFQLWSISGSNAASTVPVYSTQQQTLTFGHDISDIEVDHDRGVVYVTGSGQVHVVDMETMQIVKSYAFPGKGPFALDLSLDGTRLLIAFVSAGSVGIQNLDNDGFVEVVVGGTNGTGHPFTYDVLEARPNRLFVTASPGSGGLAYIGMVKLDENNAVSRVTSGGVVRATPVLRASPDQQFLYVGEGFSPNSLYKFDITTDDVPKVLEDQHGQVTGTDRVEVSPDGSYVYLNGGQVLRSDSFVQAAILPGGAPRVDLLRDLLYRANPGYLAVHHPTAFTELRRYAHGCDARQIEIGAAADQLYVRGQQSLCKISLLDVTATPTSTPTPTFTPTATRTPTPTRTSTPIPTSTPSPTNTPVVTPEPKCADLDLSGQVTIADVQFVIRAIQKSVTNSWFDVTLNGSVDSWDLLATARQQGRSC